MKNFKLILKSLINNEACVEGGRHRPWWISVIMLFISMVLAIGPVFYQTFKKTGSDFVSSQTYNLDTALLRFNEEIEKHDVNMVVTPVEGSSNYLEVDQNKWNEAFTYQDPRNNQYHAYQHYNAEGNVDLDVYYIPELNSTIINEINNNVPGYEIEDNPESLTWKKRNHSFIIFGKYEIVAYAYNSASSSAVGSSYGDYKNMEVGFNLKATAFVTTSDGNVLTLDKVNASNYNTFKEGVWENWKAFFNQAYLYNRGELTWRTTLLMFGINLGLTIFMGLMIFLLTRGKTNPFRIYKFMECEFIAGWATLAPGILACILGFILAQFAQLAFPLLLGVRVMWLCMKTLRADNVAPSQQSKAPVKNVNSKPVKNTNSKPTKK